MSSLYFTAPLFAGFITIRIIKVRLFHMECAQHQLFSNKHTEFSTSTSTDNIKKFCIFNIFPFPLCSLSSVIWNLWGKILIFKLNRVYFPLTVITAIPPSLGYNSMKLTWKTSVSLYSLLPSPDTNHSLTAQAELFLCVIHTLPLLALQQCENFNINT